MENTNQIQFQDDEATLFLADGQSTKGPFKPSEIYSKLNAKEVSWVDYCYREKEGAWIRIADHPVFKAIQAEPPKKKPNLALKPPPPPADTAIKWFVFQNDAQTGPYSTMDISRLIASHQVNENSFLWQETFPEWMPLNQVNVFNFKTEASVENRRTAPRKPFVAQLYLTNLKEMMTGICRDISIGGMQILCESVNGFVGETIRINVLPPDTSALTPFMAEGVIVRILEDKKGFSFRFTKLGEDVKTAIERYIS